MVVTLPPAAPCTTIAPTFRVRYAPVSNGMPRLLQANQKLAPWLVAGLAAAQLFHTGPALAAPLEAAPAPAAATASTRALDFLADASGPISLLLGDFQMPGLTDWTTSGARETLAGEVLGQDAVLAGPAKRRTGLDPAGRPCYSRLLCTAVYVAANPDDAAE
ncbi:expressed protein [Chlorella variabilis]|uniref:Expressed protein n=1 Tax=Chlorella variabilis TaxID=554065 RepID=E1Z3R0_CHLVA|nr:expressed protein [Chlorella variabilis]EFN59523.1 expressed protein [Chlorella variabilis]|eukprot:XP_005851625.1 expressed protein [Chlorella variabilis]